MKEILNIDRKTFFYLFLSLFLIAFFIAVVVFSVINFNEMQNLKRERNKLKNEKIILKKRLEVLEKIKLEKN